MLNSRTVTVGYVYSSSENCEEKVVAIDMSSPVAGYGFNLLGSLVNFWGLQMDSLVLIVWCVELPASIC